MDAHNNKGVLGYGPLELRRGSLTLFLFKLLMIIDLVPENCFAFNI